MFSPLPSKLLGNSRPLIAKLPDKFKEQDILLNGPGGMAKMRIEIIGPLFSALLQRAIIPALGKSEELVRVVFPLRFLHWLPLKVLILFRDRNKQLNFVFTPLCIIFHSWFLQRSHFVSQEIFSFLEENIFKKDIFGLGLYIICFTKRYNSMECSRE